MVSRVTAIVDYRTFTNMIFSQEVRGILNRARVNYDIKHVESENRWDGCRQIGVEIDGVLYLYSGAISSTKEKEILAALSRVRKSPLVQATSQA